MILLLLWNFRQDGVTCGNKAVYNNTSADYTHLLPAFTASAEPKQSSSNRFRTITICAGSG